MPKVLILVTNQGVDLFSRKRNQMKQTTHQEKAASNQIKARKISCSTKIPVMARDRRQLTQ